MQNITENKLYLLVKLLKEKKERVSEKEQKHNLFISANAYDTLIKYGIDNMINKLKLEEKQNAGK